MSDSRHNSSEMKPTLSRREFGKIAAGLGLASMGGFTEALQAEEKTQLLRENIDIKYTDGVMQWKIDRDRFKKFDSSNISFNLVSRKIKKPWFKVKTASSIKNMKEGKYHPDISAASVADARAVRAFASAALTFKKMNPEIENTKFYNDKAYLVPKYLRTPPDEKDPAKLTVQAKLASRHFGSDIVGCAALNRDWIYDSYQKNKFSPQEPNRRKVVFKDVPEMIETDTEMIIPDSVNNVIVVAFEMNREIIQTSPSAMANAATGLGYSRMLFHDLMLAEFIRGLGYIAIVSGNTFGLNVPLAVEAGIGEAGRLGTVITPEYGPNVRISKILTNMPLLHDKPIEFGVQEFCETCKKCARECPSKTITEGPKSYDARSKASFDGIYRWQNDYPKCLEYWLETGNECSNCVAVCPFTKGAIWVHDGVRFVIDKMRWAQPVMLGLDDAFSYGERRQEEDVWNMSIGTYGLDRKHFENSIQKGKFPL